MTQQARDGNVTESGYQHQITALRAELDQAIGVIADRNKELADLTKAVNQQIEAVHAAFGAPGDYGYESREGKALFALYRFQAESRAAIVHPTGSDKFAAVLDGIGIPAPWRLCDEEVGEVLAANGAIACNTDTLGNLSEQDATMAAVQIMLAVNTLAGFKAVAS